MLWKKNLHEIGIYQRCNYNVTFILDNLYLDITVIKAIFLNENMEFNDLHQ